MTHNHFTAHMARKRSASWTIDPNKWVKKKLRTALRMIKLRSFFGCTTWTIGYDFNYLFKDGPDRNTIEFMNQSLIMHLNNLGYYTQFRSYENETIWSIKVSWG